MAFIRLPPLPGGDKIAPRTTVSQSAAARIPRRSIERTPPVQYPSANRYIMDRNAAFMSAYAAGMRVDDVTASALHAVKRSLVDSIGCALGAYAAEPVKIARRLATRTHSDTPATLWGTHIRTRFSSVSFGSSESLGRWYSISTWYEPNRF